MINIIGTLDGMSGADSVKKECQAMAQKTRSTVCENDKHYIISGKMRDWVQAYLGSPTVLDEAIVTVVRPAWKAEIEIEVCFCRACEAEACMAKAHAKYKDDDEVEVIGIARTDVAELLQDDGTVWQEVSKCHGRCSLYDWFCYDSLRAVMRFEEFWEW